MLTNLQKQILLKIANGCFEIRSDLGKTTLGDEHREKLYVLANYAFALYHDLKTSGVELEFSGRKVPPTDPKFFFDFPVLEDMAGQLNGMVSAA